MNRFLPLIIFIFLLLNLIYIFRGHFVYPYPTGDGYARWMFVGKLIYTDNLNLSPPSSERPYRDDYPLFVPILVSLSFYLFGFSAQSAMYPYLLPYLFLFVLLLYHKRSLLLFLPLLTLPFLEGMAGRGAVGYADHFLAVFIAAALIFHHHRRYVWSIFFALLAAHTKNEGQVFSLLFFLFNLKTHPLFFLLPLNLLFWRLYLYFNNFTHFYLTAPSLPLTPTLILSRLPNILFQTLRSFFNPHIFSFAGAYLLFRTFSQPLTRYHLLLTLQLLFYLVTFLVTPTSIDYVSHYAVAVDRLLLHLLIPALML